MVLIAMGERGLASRVLAGRFESRWTYAGAISSVGPGEGSLTVLAWPGYAEDGSVDPAYDWITPFETETGCQTTVQTFGTSDEAFAKFTADPEAIDVISASGDDGSIQQIVWYDLDSG